MVVRKRHGAVLVLASIPSHRFLSQIVQTVNVYQFSLFQQPDNCLVSQYLTAQLTDFGTSRAKAHDSDSVLSKVTSIPNP